MAKYKKVNENVVDDIVEKIFGALGRAARPFFISQMVRKDKKFAKLWKQGEKNRKDINAYLKDVTKGSTITKKQRQALRSGDLPW
tara:strand:- start:1130 stop:1384 length:255 start_codon:yes stop_codon:yes gene_type:complete